jgi:hypothetical protein
VKPRAYRHGEAPFGSTFLDLSVAVEGSGVGDRQGVTVAAVDDGGDERDWVDPAGAAAPRRGGGGGGGVRERFRRRGLNCANLCSTKLILSLQI